MEPPKLQPKLFLHSPVDFRDKLEEVKDNISTLKEFREKFQLLLVFQEDISLATKRFHKSSKQDVNSKKFGRLFHGYYRRVKLRCFKKCKKEFPPSHVLFFY